MAIQVLHNIIHARPFARLPIAIRQIDHRAFPDERSDIDAIYRFFR